MNFKTFILFFIVLFFVGCEQKNEAPLKIGTNIWIGYEPLYIARELNYLKNTKLVEYSSTTEVMWAFRNSIIDGVAVTLDEALGLLNEGYDMKIVIVCDFSNGADALLTKPNIFSINELKGKKVAVENSALGAYVLSRILDLHNLTPNDIHIVESQHIEHKKLYLDNIVDAVVTFEPIKTELISMGARELFNSKEIPNEIVDILCIRESYLKDNKKSVEDVIQAWFMGVDYIKNSPNEAINIIQQRTKLSKDDILTALSGIDFPNRDENRKLVWSEKESIVLKNLKELKKVMINLKLINGDINEEKLILKSKELF